MSEPQDGYEPLWDLTDVTDVPARFARLVTVRPDAKQVIRSVVPKWAEAQDRCLLLTGMTGRGKTQLAWMAMDVYWRKHHDGQSVNVTTATAWAADFVQLAGYTDHEAQKPLGYCRNSALLLLDDLGAEDQDDARIAAQGRRRLHDLVNTMYVRRKPLILTTNMTSETFGE